MHETECLARLLVRTDDRIPTIRSPELREVLIDAREATAARLYKLRRDQCAQVAAAYVEHVVEAA